MTLAPSRPDVFPFEKLPAELRVIVSENVLISPCGWFNITWARIRHSSISVTKDLSRAEILSKMCISMLYLNSEPTFPSRYLMIRSGFELQDRPRRLLTLCKILIIQNTNEKDMLIPASRTFSSRSLQGSLRKQPVPF